MFSEAYDLMPALPRPLKSKHALVYITANGLMRESLSVAPLTRTEEKRLEELKLDHIRAVEGDRFESLPSNGLVRSPRNARNRGGPIVP